MKKMKSYLFLLIAFLTFSNLNSIINIISSYCSSNYYDIGNKFNPKNKFNSYKIKYQINNSSVEMVTGLASYEGNTNGKPIIATKVPKFLFQSTKPSLKIFINKNFIDLSRSYYEQGDVDKKNNFIGRGKVIKNLSKKFIISEEGIYHLHLADFYGVDYDSYLEIGSVFHKLNAIFSFESIIWFEKLANRLNVNFYNTVWDIKKLENFIIYLNKYQYDVEKAYHNSIKSQGRGFDNIIKRMHIKYQDFLGLVDYENNPIEKIDFKRLNKIIARRSKNILDIVLLIIENNTNMHGYSLNQLVNINQLPKAKQEIDNYDGNKSFSQWLQEKANKRFYFWQLEIRITIESLILMLLIILTSIFLYWQHKKIYLPLILKEFIRYKKNKISKKEREVIINIYSFIKLNAKKNSGIFWKKCDANIFLQIQNIFKNNLEKINFKNYDNMFYCLTKKNVLSGKQFISTFLNCRNISDYVHKIKFNSFESFINKLHTTILYDTLSFYVDKVQDYPIKLPIINLDVNTKIQLANIQSFLKYHEWNYYFFEMQNLMHLTLVNFLNWKNKALNFNSYSKLLKRKLLLILKSQEKVENYISTIQLINSYRNLLSKVVPLKQNALMEWNNLSIMDQEKIALNIYYSLIDFIKFTKENANFENQ